MQHIRIKDSVCPYDYPFIPKSPSYTWRKWKALLALLSNIALNDARIGRDFAGDFFTGYMFSAK